MTRTEPEDLALFDKIVVLVNDFQKLIDAFSQRDDEDASYLSFVAQVSGYMHNVDAYM